MKQRILWRLDTYSDPPRVKYGEKSTTQSLSRVLEYVTENFNYTSLAELNTVLRLYNVAAYPGKPGSQLYRHHGLLYRILDEHGNYIGVPLKASFFDCQPTLANLEQKFAQNQLLRQERCLHLRAMVSWELYKEHQDLKSFEEGLEREQIYALMQRDRAGQCKEVSYVDFQKRCVVNGDELGRNGDRSAIQEIIDRERTLEQQQSLHQELVPRQRLSHPLF